MCVSGERSLIWVVFEVFWGVGVVSAFEQLQLELGLGLSDRGVDG